MKGTKVGQLRKDDFYVPILRQLESMGGSASIEELDNRIIEQFGFDEDELGATYPKSGALIIPDKIKWGRSRLKKAGLLDSGGRGVWVLTDAGRGAIAKEESEIQNIVAVAMREYHRDYQTKQKARWRDLYGDGELATSPPQFASAGDDDESESEPEWSDILLAKLQIMDPSAFERLCRRMLLESGFTRVEVTGKAGDGGIDGHGVLRVNLISFQVLFQCKRYSDSVRAGVIRDFRGAMQGRADKGLIITTGTFTPDARREATRDGAPAIDLIDGEALTELLKSLRLGVRVEQVVTEQVGIEEHFFDEI